MSLDQTNPETSPLPVLVRHSGAPLAPPSTELHLEPSDGPRLLNQVAEAFKRYLVLPVGAADALALMVAHFHCYDAFLHTPRLSFQAVEKGCGKTTALELTACLSPRSLIAESVSTAVLFRVTEIQGVTILLDEVDAWLLGNEEMRGILNAGHRRAGQVLRCGKENSVRKYNVFAPVVLAGIGALPDTLQDRSIVIRLTRAKPGELNARFDPRKTDS
jgi:hypothetical protein